MKSGKNATLVATANRYLLPNYRPMPLVLEHGAGAVVSDADGNEYIDFVAGIAVSSLGHANEEIARVICEQSRKILHTSNIVLNVPEVELAKSLCEASSLQRVFFCNSGAEANEAMLKLARRVFLQSDPERIEIVCMSKAFHGRTFGTISATGQEKYRNGFGPLLPGFRFVPFGDIEALKNAVTPKTAAIILEPMLGEGGVVVPPEGYLAEVRKLCDSSGCLMLLDEVQTGMGRTGLLFAHQHEGILPDAMALAKGLGGGLPIGALLVKESLAQVLSFPTHGSTFGGNPVACAAANVVMKTVNQPTFLAHVKGLEVVLRKRLLQMKEKYPHLIRDIRGKGLLFGAEFVNEAGDFKERAISRGLIVNFCADRVLRIAPPLVIQEDTLMKGLNIIEELLHAQ